MAQSVIIKLTDDLEGGDADETIEFALDGKAYQIDLNKRNAKALRDAFSLYIEKGRGPRRDSRINRDASSNRVTLYSTLSSQEKKRFRAWAELPDARRIGDSRVKEWVEAGRP